MNRFEDKVALISGAGAGIGRAAAQRIAAEHGSVFCVDLDQAAAGETASLITESGGEATAYACDIGDESAVRACVAACVERYGSLHALVNMAGVLRFDDFEQLQTAHFQKVIDVNLTGTMMMCREALPHLIASKGSIVNAASTAALSGLPGGAAYSASKGAVLAMTRSIAVDFAKRGVRANCICPGSIKTDMSKGIDFPEGFDWDLLPRTMSISEPVGPEAVAGLIAMLVSDDGVHITGEDIRVDGGTLS